MNRFLNGDKGDHVHKVDEAEKPESLKFAHAKQNDIFWKDEKDKDQTFSISKEVLAQLEQQMLHNDLKRDSFRARTATHNFVTNPIFEDSNEFNVDQSLKISTASNSLKNNSNQSDDGRNRYESMEDSKFNCVENVLVDFSKIKRTSSLKRPATDTQSVGSITRRYNSLKRYDRNLP